MDVDAVVIGAGVIGLAVARRLALAGREVIVIEEEKTIGSHTSSRNSEVIHAGMYYPEGSLKAKLCVAGRKALYAYCAERDIAHKRVGKLIVATSEAQVPKLGAILSRGLANGVDDLRLIDRAEAAALEPEVNCLAALYSPSTGIIDSQAYMLALQAEAESLGGQFAFMTRVVGIRRRGDAFIVETESSEAAELECAMVVNCAGLGAQEIAHRTEGLAAERIPRRFLAKGNYFSVSGATPFRHLIYPMPMEGGLGVHVTLDMSGRMRLGPDVHWVDRVEYTPVAGLEDSFRTAVRTYWPAIEGRDILSSYCGIRPKISGPGEEAADFRIDGPKSHGVSGLVNCFGLESPGLTSSLAIADKVAEKLLVAN